MKKLICILLLAGISCASSQRIERQECQSAPEQAESAGREDGLKTGLAIDELLSWIGNNQTWRGSRAPDVWAIDSKTDFYDSGTGYDFNLVTGSSQTCGRHPTWGLIDG